MNNKLIIIKINKTMKNLSKLVNQNIFKRSFSSYIGKNMSENNQTFYAKDLIIDERVEK